MKKILAVTMIVLFAVSLVFAAEDVFSKLDKNKDGKISKKEYMEATTAVFERLDKNHDGVITRDELAHMDKKDADQFIKETDINKDGKIIKKEYDRAAAKRFKQLDKNRDGFINKREWDAAGRSEIYSPFTRFNF